MNKDSKIPDFSPDFVKEITKIPLEEREFPRSVLEGLERSARLYPNRPALSYQLQAIHNESSKTYKFSEFIKAVRQTANAFHSLDPTQNNTVAILAPNCPQAVIACCAAQVYGTMIPINPMLDPEQIESILRTSQATILVTLAPFPKSYLHEKVHQAVQLSPRIHSVLEIDLKNFLPLTLRLLASLIRSRSLSSYSNNIKLFDFAKYCRKQNSESLDFTHSDNPERTVAIFHTGGTTGSPKLVQHKNKNVAYMLWVVNYLLINKDDVLLCALPLFHVFAIYTLILAPLFSGAHTVVCGARGFRDPDIYNDFWRLLECWRITCFCAIPDVFTTLLQKPVNADISSVRIVINGSASLAKESLISFREHTGLTILEGYGQIESTCAFSCNPPGREKFGSAGIPLPYLEARIVNLNSPAPTDSVSTNSKDCVITDCAPNEVGEILVRGPSIFNGYIDTLKENDFFFDLRWFKTGDRGHLDEEGYLWISGRSKDLIIRDGHIIDCRMIEEAFMRHPDVACAVAIAQPDRYAGELPAVYLELVQNSTANKDAILEITLPHIPEKTAYPVYVGILHKIPRTFLEKIYKSTLRKIAAERVFRKTMVECSDIPCTLRIVPDIKSEFLTIVTPTNEDDTKRLILDCENFLSDFVYPWKVEAAKES